MATLDSFKKAKAEVSTAGKSAGFKNAMKKYDLVAAFRNCGLDVNDIGVVNDKGLE